MTAKTKAQLQVKIEETFPDNIQGFITPAMQRSYESDLVDSIPFLNDGSDVSVIATGTTTPRTLEDRFSEHLVNIKDFGLKSNEMQANFDNATLWETAIDSGEDLFIPEGTWIQSAGIEMRSGLVLTGRGVNSTLKLANGSNAHVLYAWTGESDIRLSRFRIDGNKANQTLGNSNNRGVYFIGGIRVLIDDITLDDVLDHGIAFSGGSAALTTTTGVVAASTVIPVASTTGILVGTLMRGPGVVDFPTVVSIGAGQVTVTKPQNLASGLVIHFLLESGQDSVISRCRVNRCGSSAHLAAGGAGGTSFTGGGRRTVWRDNTAVDGRLNGFKMNVGLLVGCRAIFCGNGFETGFVSTQKDVTIKYIGCEALYCDGGWLHASSGDEITHIGCVADGCATSGVTIKGPVRRVTFTNCLFKNNGRRTGIFATYARVINSVGLDGVSILANSGTPQDIFLNQIHCYDDQNVKTQDWGLYVEDFVTQLHIGDGCDFRGNLTGGVRLTSANDTTTVAPSVRGYGAEYQSTTPVAVTGTLTTTDLMKTTVPGRTLKPGSVIKVIGYGTVTGTAGTKIVRLVVGATSTPITNQTAGEQQAWAVQATITAVSNVTLLIQVEFYEVAGTSGVAPLTVNQTLANDMVLGFNVSLGNVADTVTQSFMGSWAVR